MSNALRDQGIHYLSRKKYKKAVPILEESYQLAMESVYITPASIRICLLLAKSNRV